MKKFHQTTRKTKASHHQNIQRTPQKTNQYHATTHLAPHSPRKKIKHHPIPHSMCPNQQIPELSRLETVIEIIHMDSQEHNEPIDFYRLHDCFATTDEPEDDVADENHNVGWEFGYGRPDIRNYVFENEEVRAAAERYLNDFWPVQRRFSDEESERVCEDGDGGDCERDSEEQGVGGDGDGDQVRTNIDTTTAAVAAIAAEEEEVSTNSRYTNPENFVALTPANTPTLRYFRLPANNNASAREVRAHND
jgi:hypothetical protein